MSSVLEETIYFLQNKDKYSVSEQKAIKKELRNRTKDALKKVTKGLIKGIDDINSI